MFHIYNASNKTKTMCFSVIWEYNVHWTYLLTSSVRVFVKMMDHTVVYQNLTTINTEKVLFHSVLKIRKLSLQNFRNCMQNNIYYIESLLTPSDVISGGTVCLLHDSIMPSCGIRTSKNMFICTSCEF